MHPRFEILSWATITLSPVEQRRDETCIPKQSLYWKPDGRRERRPKNTWRRNLDKEIQDNRMNWKQVEAAAQDTFCIFCLTFYDSVALGAVSPD